MFDPPAFILRKVADESNIFVWKRCVYGIERWRMKASSMGRLQKKINSHSRLTGL